MDKKITYCTKSCPLNTPEHPIISDTPSPLQQQDALQRISNIIALLQALDFSQPLTPTAESGLYWILNMLEDTVDYISRSFGQDENG